MKHSINHKIGYAVATLICASAVLFFAHHLKGMQNTQKELDKANFVFEKTNALVSSLNQARAYSERYITTRDAYYLQRYSYKSDKGLQVMDALFSELRETQQEQLLALEKLFEEKKILLQRLSDTTEFPSYLDVLVKHAQMPVYDVNKHSYGGSQLDVDTTFVRDNRGFLQRVFARGQGPSQIITIRQSDSVVDEYNTTQYVPSSATTAFDDLVRIIERNQKNQKRQLRILEEKYRELIIADQKIGQDISTILIELHEMALNRLEEVLLQKESLTRKILLSGILAFLVVFGAVFTVYQNLKKSLEAKRITEELMQARHQLLLSISHDINAPLCSILTYLEFWKKDDLSREEIRQLSSMQSSATHILDMLKNLLEFSRLEQNKSQIQNQTIEPIPLFLEIVDLFKPMTDEKNINFSYQFKNLNDSQITIDPLKLRQIVTNLISNAVKYTMEGEIQLFVERLEDPECLKIIVSDTGIGIPAERLDVIFDPFIQIENRFANIEGSGLGLFVVKGLTDVMNGTIGVESSEKGTTFHLELPL